MDELAFSGRFLRTFGNGDVLFEEGSVGKHMYVIVSGSVRIVKKSEGEVVVIAAPGKGELFGEMALVDSQPRSASAIAVADETSVVEIDHAQFSYPVGQQPAFALIILKALSLRLRDQMEINRRGVLEARAGGRTPEGEVRGYPGPDRGPTRSASPCAGRSRGSGQGTPSGGRDPEAPSTPSRRGRGGESGPSGSARCCRDSFP